MLNVETEYPSPPDMFLDDVLTRRPPLPVDQVDISALRRRTEGLAPVEPGYAWERLPRWLAEVEDSFIAVGASPIVCLDICSSIPLYAQLLRAGEFSRCGRRARDLANELIGDSGMLDLKEKSPDLVPLAAKVQRAPDTRKLLYTALQEALYDINLEDKEPEDGGSTFFDRLQNKLLYQQCVYEQERSDVAMETSWGFRFNTVPTGLSYFEQLCLAEVPTKEALAASKRLAGTNQRERHLTEEVKRDRVVVKQTQPAGAENALRYVNWQANRLTSMVVTNKRYRPARFLSMDASDPEDIALSSLVNTPDTTQSMNLFSHAVGSLFDRRLHIVGDILEDLNIPDNSLTLITDFDGWPFHHIFDVNDQAEAEQFAYQAVRAIRGFYEKLAYGGKIVIFPWAVAGGDLRTKSILDGVVAELARTFHHGIDKKVFHRDTLVDWMSESDRESIVQTSPIFTDNNVFYEALVIKKPQSSLVSTYSKALGQTAVRQD